MLVRTEILQALRNRLQLADLWRRRPELLDAPIDEPVFIVGSPRSGTSILHELMASDPATRAPAMWEMQHPVDAVEGHDRSELGDMVTRFWHDVQPEYETMHANSGHPPNECIFITLHQFLSDHWSGCHVAPTYEGHLYTTDQTPAYAFHRRFLQTLQQRSGPRRWLLKAPSHLSQLRTLFAVYPDAKHHPHPPGSTQHAAVGGQPDGHAQVDALPEVDMRHAPAQLAAGLRVPVPAGDRAARLGRAPRRPIRRRPLRCAGARPGRHRRGRLRALGWTFTDEARSAVAAYAAAKPRGSRGVHRYSLEEMDLDPDEERERFRFYTDHYGVTATDR